MKEKIVKIAIKQLSEGGYDNLNFRDIAEELGVTRANLHHHFKNKEGLGIAATEAYIELERTEMNSAIQKHDGDIKSILRHLEDHLIAVFTSHDALYTSCLLSQLIHDKFAPAPMRALAIKRIEEETKTIENQIKKAKQTGNLQTTRDEKHLSFQIMATMFGIAKLALIKTSNSKLKQSIKGSLVTLVS